MKNVTLKRELKSILANPKIVVAKGDVGGNSIEVTIQEPVFEDLGSYIYDRVEDRDADFTELQTLKQK